jgi:hypothetical protein
LDVVFVEAGKLRDDNDFIALIFEIHRWTVSHLRELLSIGRAAAAPMPPSIE